MAFQAAVVSTLVMVVGVGSVYVGEWKGKGKKEQSNMIWVRLCVVECGGRREEEDFRTKSYRGF